MRAAMECGDWLAAIAEAEAWLRRGGRDWRVTLNLAVCGCRARHGTEAHWLSQAEAALQQSGHHPLARLGAAEVHGALGHWEQVLDLLSALECPQPWPSLQMRCEALARLGRASEAWAILEAWPPARRDWRWRLALADGHVQASQWSAAEAEYRAVLAERPDQGEVHQNLALALLSQRRCAEAWPHYEWRRSNPRLDQRGIPRPLPSLESLSCRTVVVRGEQGVGDQIMTSRYLRALAGACRSLIVEPAPRLVELFRHNLPAQIAVESPGCEWPDAVVIGMASLPMLFWSELGCAAPGPMGYLKADPHKIDRWRSRLALLPRGLRLGVGWLGGVTGAERRERALTSRDLRQLGSWPGVQWLDLQFLAQDQQHLADVSREAALQRLGNPGFDLDDTLALIQCLDGVVTTRQSVAHLTGALGRPGQVLVPARPEWRYWGDENRWAWYPSMQLIPQERRGDWQTQLEGAAQQWLVP